MDLQDCVTFPKYDKFPPRYVLRYHGINPVVCCPPADVVLFPDEFETFSSAIFNESSELTENYQDYTYYNDYIDDNIYYAKVWQLMRLWSIFKSKSNGVWDFDAITIIIKVFPQKAHVF